MAKKSRKRRRSTSEKIMIILGIIIAISMMLSLFVGLGASRGDGNAPLPESERFDPDYEGVGEPLGALDPGTVGPIASIPVGAIAPPIS